MQKSFDLSTIDTVKGANKGFELDLLSPSKEKTGVIFTLLGGDSDVFVKLKREQERKRLRRIQKSGGYLRGNLDLESADEENTDLIASCITGWTPFELEKGKGDLPFSKENAIKVLTQYPDIREQVDTAIGDRGNFTAG